MRIDFERVSYAYGDVKRKSKQTNTTVYPKPAWGGDPGAPWALKDISFSLKEGEFLGIAGHTGSGKSTLIQHMNALLHPLEGRVLVDGENLAHKRTAKAMRGAIGVVFQYPEQQLFAASVFEDVAFGPRNLGNSTQEVNTRVQSALESVHLDIDEVGSKSPFALSGGQQRRVAFAGVLAMQPQVLVLDEPVAGLDPVAREEFLELVNDLHTKGRSIVLVSHSMDDLARFADRILVLNEGTQALLDTPEKVFAQGEALKTIGLDVPAPQKMAEELRASGIPLPRLLYTTETLADNLAALYHQRAQYQRPETEGFHV